MNEAAAAGLAIVSSNVPGASVELVRTGINGEVFQSGDVESLVDALRRVTDPNTIDRLKAGSRGVLEDWRRRADPVAGLRDALFFCGALSHRQGRPTAHGGLGPASADRPIRVVIQQPVLPRYRVPLFRELAARPGIDLRVVYAERPELPNADPDGFRGTFMVDRQLTVLDEPLYWSDAQLRYIDPHDVDVLILSWDLHYLSLLPALVHAWATGVPTIVWGHGYSQRETPFSRWLRLKIASYATSVLLYSRMQATTLVAEGWDPQQIHVALNSLDQTPIERAKEAWLANPERLARFRRAEQLVGPMILFVSRLSDVKRLDLLFRAVARIVPSYPTIQIVVIGDGEDRALCEQAAAAKGLQSHARFLGAIYDEAQLAPWFLSADVFCYPRHLGLSLLHAFGYGLPVVTSDDLSSHGPEVEAIEPEINGLLFADGDEAALAAALERLLRDPALRQRMSEHALRTVRERFSMRLMVDGMVKAIQHAAVANVPRVASQAN
jgi:glycosyltransferase involved in cell wall biosynthesis